jgi:putative nucleotidyltransferase with HDIG domain
MVGNNTEELAEEVKMTMSSTDEQRKQVERLVAEVADLKPLPTTVTTALRLMEDENSSVEEIASIVSVDQAVAARLLRFANSAYYGTIQPCTTVSEALCRLGFRKTKNILLAASYSSLLGRRLAGYNLGRGELWRHSVAVATAAQRLSSQVDYPAPEEAYIGGLLHDIGKLVLDQYMKVDWDELLAAGESGNRTLIASEELLLGMNHVQVGGTLAKSWALPACLVDAIAHHHYPPMATTSPQLAAIVHIADAICLRLGIGLAHYQFLPTVNPEALRILKITETEIDFLTNLYNDILDTQFMVEADLMLNSRK